MTSHQGQFKKGHVPLSYRHGMAHTKIYYVWQAMRSRCEKQSHKDFEYYGARGIRVDARWSDFVEFYRDMGDGYAHGLELERIDNNGNYCKANCRWVDKVTQRNNKRSNHYVECNGERKTLAQWSRDTGINYSTLRSRFARGKDVTTALCEL